MTCLNNSIHRDVIKTSNISILIFWINQQCNSFVVKKWLKIEPWPFKCYSTIIWCMVENVGIYSAWYFIIWIYCAKRISTFTSEFLWSFYRKWWRKEHIFFLHSLNYLLYEYYKIFNLYFSISYRKKNMNFAMLAFIYISICQKIQYLICV